MSERERDTDLEAGTRWTDPFLVADVAASCSTSMCRWRESNDDLYGRPVVRVLQRNARNLPLSPHSAANSHPRTLPLTRRIPATLRHRRRATPRAADVPLRRSTVPLPSLFRPRTATRLATTSSTSFLFPSPSLPRNALSLPPTPTPQPSSPPVAL